MSYTIEDAVLSDEQFLQLCYLMIYNGISKIRAAEEQLKTAVDLFFRYKDPISTEELARELISYLKRSSK